MKTDHHDLSYYMLRLTELLESSFPERLSDTKFISERSEIAAKTYEESFNSGYQVRHCMKAAETVLFQGLGFSKFDLLFKLLCNEFGFVMPDEYIRPMAIKMLTECESIFAGYIIEDDFEDTEAYTALYSELTGCIQIWIDDHGL